MPTKVDSNLTGLRIAVEASLGVLPVTPVWEPQEPNSYGDFGAQITTVSRNPINPDRQREKGVTVDLDAAGTFNSDLTPANFEDLYPGFFFAAYRRKERDTSDNATPTAGNMTGVDGTLENFEMSSGGTDYLVGALVFSSGFLDPANNRLSNVTAVAAGLVTVASDLVDEAVLPAAALLQVVGFLSAVGDIDVDTTGADPVLTSTILDFTTLGLIPGEWIRIGGDGAFSDFVTAGNNGFARVKTIAANALTLDKTENTMATEANTTQFIELYFGDVIKNELAALISRTTYQLERELGGEGFEYVRGAVANRLALTFGTADKVAAELSFVSQDANAVLLGARESGLFPTLGDQREAFNTTSDFSRLRFDKDDGTGLATFLTELTVEINNNLTPAKALATLGAFEITAGDFLVTGTLSGYFEGIDVINSVRANDDATIDMALIKEQKGLLFDVPRISLGDGRLAVEKDAPILVPITYEAARHPVLNHTMLLMLFSYLPLAAE